MKQRTIIANGQVVLPDQVLAAGEVAIEDGIIVYAGPGNAERRR